MHHTQPKHWCAEGANRPAPGAPRTLPHVQVTRVPARTRGALTYLLTCVPRAVRVCLSAKEPALGAGAGGGPASALEGGGGGAVHGSGGVAPHDTPGPGAGGRGLLGGLRARWVEGDKGEGREAQVNAATAAAAEAVRMGQVSDDVRAGETRAGGGCWEGLQLFPELQQCGPTLQAKPEQAGVLSAGIPGAISGQAGRP